MSNASAISPSFMTESPCNRALRICINRPEIFKTQLRAVLWKDDVRDDDRQRHYFAQIVHEFRDRLSQIGCGEIFVQSRDSYAVVPELIECDYYHALRKEQDFLADFTGEYMSQYEWADMRVGTIEKELKGGKNIQNQEKTVTVM